MEGGLYANSKLKAVVDSLKRRSRKLATAYQSSHAHRAFNRLATVMRHSYLYRWLTAEPDPEVVVIDLRETYTVGPVLAALDRLADPMQRAWQNATSRRLAASVTDAVRQAPIRAVSILIGAVLLTNLAFTLAFASPSSADVVVRVVLLGVALVGTRVTTPWSILRTARTVRVLRAVFEPPEPPRDTDADQQSNREDKS